MSLDTAWSQLATIRELKFSASSGSSTGWDGEGGGTVNVREPSSNVLVYEESGTWTKNNGSQLSFTNTYRWTLLVETIRLEHLRFGEDKPVYLFDLAFDGDSNLSSIAPHV